MNVKKYVSVEGRRGCEGAVPRGRAFWTLQSRADLRTSCLHIINHIYSFIYILAQETFFSQEHLSALA